MADEAPPIPTQPQPRPLLPQHAHGLDQPPAAGPGVDGTYRYYYEYEAATGVFTGRHKLVRGAAPSVEAGMALLVASSPVDTRAAKVDIATGEVVDAVPAQPSDTPDATFEWDTESKRWVPRLTLNGHKRKRWALIKQTAAARDADDITVGAHELKADAQARATLMQAITIAQLAAADGQPFSFEIDKADESVVTVNAAQLKAIIRAIHARTEAIRATARSLRAQIMAATTVAEVNAIEWP